MLLSMPHANPEVRRAYMKDWRKKTGKQKEYDARRKPRNPDQVRKSRLKQDYGITHDDYITMHEKQGGKCAICRGVNDDGALLVVDHNHETMKVRKLLCRRCNWMIGHAKEDVSVLAAGIAYLEEHRA
jgi:hypothetical protein